MKYQDSIEQASEKAALTVAFLQRHRLAAHPVNYTVIYEYINGQNDGLCLAIEQKLAVQSNFDDFVLAELYSQWLTPQHQRQEELTQQVTTMLAKLSGTTDIASEAVQHYIDVLDQALLGLDPNNANRSRDSVNKVISATYAIKASQQKLKDQLDFSNEQCHALRSELDHLKKERQLDPLTGLYNRLAMQEHLDLWLTENPGRRIAAIAVNLDHFAQFNQDYGFGVGDVILSKVARKIASYVQESGLPVRSGGEEFLILLPDVDLRTAGEIAEQVRKGVEKLRFVSAKSKKTLPKVTISLGVSIYNTAENWHQFLSRSSKVLQEAKVRGRNQVATELMLAN